MSVRRRRTAKQRLAIFERDGGVCCLCSGKIDGTREAWEIHHVIELEAGGSDDDDNLAPAHVRCPPPTYGRGFGAQDREDEAHPFKTYWSVAEVAVPLAPPFDERELREMTESEVRPTTDPNYPGWRNETCGICRGIGIVADAGGGPTGCRDCGENGAIWISPKGRIALYPGGPFLGSYAR